MSFNFRNIYRSYQKRNKFISFYKQFINSGNLCFDIGANIGERTEFFSSLGCNVVSLEPQPICIGELMEKFTRIENVKVIDAAVSNKNGFSELWLCNINECATFSEELKNAFKVENEIFWNEKIKVKTVTLDELIKEYGLPDYCKVDVEGWESIVFEGLTQPIKNIAFEFNYPLLTDTIKCIQHLSELGNATFNYVEFENMKIILPEWKNVNDFLRVINNFSPSVLTGEILVRYK